MKTVLWISLLFVSLVGCKEKEVYCQNGVCVCAEGDNCDMECVAPPCEATCVGDGTVCDGVCGNSSCNCGPGAVCDFECHSAPCHVNCDNGDFCSGVCANGSCNCSTGSTCSFDCLSGPCLVNCEGNNPHCDGVAANGTSTCGPGSTCNFGCLDDDCHIVCEAGATCTLNCPNGNAGIQGCSFSTCAAGEPIVCEGGFYTTCGTPCPVDTDSSL